MKVNTLLWFSMLTILLTACQTSKKITADNFHLYEIPPNGIRVSDNLFCDQTEMNNFGWMEYLYWNKKIFGAASIEYTSALPDTSVWLKADTCLHAYVDSYLRHPAYRHYPVVGITQKQALNYSKWRSDRVFESLLIKLKIIESNTAQTKKNHFTIEKNFNGEVPNVISEKKVNYYPEYRLPNLDERQFILAYSDSTDKAYFEKCNSEYCRDCSERFPEMWSNIAPCVNDLVGFAPTRNVHTNCASKKGNPIYNLRGNVGEWTSGTTVAVGGGWRDNREQILKMDTFNLTEPNAWTGFRNVCEWKKWVE